VSEAIYLLEEGPGPIVAVAIHDGHAVRPEVARCLALDDATRLREEDPFTGRLAAVAPTRLVAVRSRFEVDLNRERDAAVYLGPAQAWGLEPWHEQCTPDLVAGSLAVYDAFYSRLDGILRERARRHGRFVVLDIHSYNHRRDAPGGPPADAAANPEINLGTGTVDRARWGPLVDRFRDELAAAEVAGHRLDVRENVKFRGGALSAWVHRSFPATGCALALEFKKTFMDEWTGEVDEEHLAALGRALAATLPGLVESLAS
jgi:N-formylglutamate deformylase